jgi:hypothetical protein
MLEWTQAQTAKKEKRFISRGRTPDEEISTPHHAKHESFSKDLSGACPFG